MGYDSRNVKVLEEEYWDWNLNECIVSDKQVIIEDNQEIDELTINKEVLKKKYQMRSQPLQSDHKEINKSQVTSDDEVCYDGELVHFAMSLSRLHKE